MLDKHIFEFFRSKNWFLDRKNYHNFLIYWPILRAKTAKFLQFCVISETQFVFQKNRFVWMQQYHIELLKLVQVHFAFFLSRFHIGDRSPLHLSMFLCPNTLIRSCGKSKVKKTTERTMLSALTVSVYNQIKQGGRRLTTRSATLN